MDTVATSYQEKQAILIKRNHGSVELENFGNGSRLYVVRGIVDEGEVEVAMIHISELLARQKK